MHHAHAPRSSLRRSGRGAPPVSGRPGPGSGLWAFLALLLWAVTWAPSPPRADYPQVRLNTDMTSELQNEQCIIVNPTDPSNLVACWRDFRLGYRQVAVGYTVNHGVTWTDFLIGGELPWDSDPVLSVSSDGTFYLVVLNFLDGVENQLSVHRSSTKGATWEGPFTAVYSPTWDVIEDKPWIAVDRSGGAFDGSVYVAWGRFYDRDIKLVRSDDGGETWTAPIAVSNAVDDGNWAIPLVLKNGNLLVAWSRFSDGHLAYDISSDGGSSWLGDQPLTSSSLVPGIVLNGGIQVLGYASLALDESASPRAGWVYCLYVDIDPMNGVDIFCRRSTNHGVTWSAPVRVNDDPAGTDRDQFHPWVTCDANGTLAASWYDRRDDPSNFDWHLYMAQSHDGGATWSPNVRITDVPSSPAAAVAGGTARAGLLGEYSGIAMSLNTVFPVWTDTRNGHQDTYTSRINVVTEVPGGPLASGAEHVSVRPIPNPSMAGATLELYLGSPAEAVSVEIVDAQGRLVWRNRLGSVPAGRFVTTWDGRTASGFDPGPGVYLARVHGVGDEVIGTKLVRLR